MKRKKEMMEGREGGRNKGGNERGKERRKLGGREEKKEGWDGRDSRRNIRRKEVG